MLDGEFKVMGMAPYGDPTRFDIGPLIRATTNGFKINNKLVNCVGWRRYKRKNGQGTFFAQRLVNIWGPPREGDEIDEPYVHIAASVQKALRREPTSSA